MVKKFFVNVGALNEDDFRFMLLTFLFQSDGNQPFVLPQSHTLIFQPKELSKWIALLVEIAIVSSI